jgi:hypothetical protein
VDVAALAEAVGECVADQVPQRPQQVAFRDVNDDALARDVHGQCRAEVVGAVEQCGGGFLGERARGVVCAASAAGAEPGEGEQVLRRRLQPAELTLAGTDGLTGRVGDRLVRDEVEVSAERVERGVDVVREAAAQLGEHMVASVSDRVARQRDGECPAAYPG